MSFSTWVTLKNHQYEIIKYHSYAFWLNTSYLRLI